MQEIIVKILETGLQQGIWTVLYLFLFFFQLKESRDREQKYQAIIKELHEKIEAGIGRIETGIKTITGKSRGTSSETDDPNQT